MRERDLIESIKAKFKATKPGIETGIGDDCAVIFGDNRKIVIGLDFTISDLHISEELAGPKDLGFKAVTRAVSDVAAMGANIEYCLIGLALSGPNRKVALDGILEGIYEATQFYSVDLIGGDLSASKKDLACVVAVGVLENKALLRSGASLGDAIWLTGPTGKAGAFLRTAGKLKEYREAYLRPVARLKEGILISRLKATSCIDVSDGLLSDLMKLARDSGVGFKINSPPLPEGVELSDALEAGDDYELVFGLDPRIDPTEEFRKHNLNSPILLGHFVENGKYILNGSPLNPKSVGGYDYTW
jgi:thiamine-monophosphate kinase